ncbi:nitroreductase family protein [Variovorax sp. RA8]|uniref:nitroreductase family protein n=1 Tax=Variovorax sp. (strain JCM 16519 / RA8) TaxID=662548 RepID=UPI0013172247|nr:nitroreductase family protein [Variovorax sp. RA8]VTU13582.1 Putative NAD(P)H nitroreductase YdjA [Variovorax sp. RA8]
MNASVNPAGPAPSSFGELAQRRRSVYAYVDEPVPRHVIERALADAVLAPNHHRTAPWRFFVITRDARHRLVSAYEAAARRTERDVARAAQRAQDAPVNVVVACVPTLDNPRVVAREEEFATAAAVQNFLLSLADAGVGSLLTTGALAESPEVAALVGLDAPGAHVVGVINVGYPNPQRPIPRRPDAQPDRVVRWLDAH